MHNFLCLPKIRLTQLRGVAALQQAPQEEALCYCLPAAWTDVLSLRSQGKVPLITWIEKSQYFHQTVNNGFMPVGWDAESGRTLGRRQSRVTISLSMAATGLLALEERKAYPDVGGQQE